MCQSEILKVLKRNKNKWLKTNEIARELNQNNNAVRSCLSRLYKYREISKKEVRNCGRGAFMWKIK